MCGGVVQLFGHIVALAYDAASADDDGTDRYLVFRCSKRGLTKGLAHIFLVNFHHNLSS